MGRWILMLGGMSVWAAHFMGVYGIASVADVAADAAVPASRWTIGAFTLACAAAAALFGLAGLRRLRAGGDSLDRLSWSVAAFGGAFATIAILWQGLPALVGH